MRVAIVENTRITHHGQVGVALHERAALIDLIKPWSGQSLPRTVDADALVVFGGEQSATDDHSHPYLPELARLMAAYAAMDRREDAVDQLIAIIEVKRDWNEEAARMELLKFFEAWGPTDEATADGRRKLSSAWFS